MASIDKMRPVIARSEALSVHDDWALEDRKNENREEDEKGEGNENGGEESAIYVNIVGWVDVEAHIRFQASEDFRENVHWLLGIEGLRRMEMHHVKLERV